MDHTLVSYRSRDTDHTQVSLPSHYRDVDHTLVSVSSRDMYTVDLSWSRQLSSRITLFWPQSKIQKIDKAPSLRSQIMSYAEKGEKVCKSTACYQCQLLLIIKATKAVTREELQWSLVICPLLRRHSKNQIEFCHLRAKTVSCWRLLVFLTRDPY